jgi:hypothetical protein
MSPAARELTRGLIVAAVFLGLAAAIRLLSPEHLSHDLGQRLLGVTMGLVVAFYANAVPKALSPLILMRCDPAAEQAMRRFTGWCLALGGAAYAVTWLIAPVPIAKIVATSLLGAALLLVVARIALKIKKGKSA